MLIYPNQGKKQGSERLQLLWLTQFHFAFLDFKTCTQRHSPLNADVLHFIMFATKFGTWWALSSSEFELIRLMPRNLIGSGCK